MNNGKKVPLHDVSEQRTVAVVDMDTVQEENDNYSDDSSSSDIERLRDRTRLMFGSAAEPLMPVLSQPSSRRMSTDLDVKITTNLNTRRPSVIIAAFRRPSQALALCAATQKKFLSEVSPHSRASATSLHIHDSGHTHKDVTGQEALGKALSALYAKLLVVLGLAFPVTEVIAKGITDMYYQGFYLYLYGVSVAFIIFQYVILFRSKTTSSFTIEDNNGDEKADKHDKDSHKDGDQEKLSRYGSFYLRLGVIAFGIGSMVYSGLAFGEYFEMNDQCRSALTALTPALRMALTLLQIQFIFLTNKDIEKCTHKVLQRFGFMHIVATNLCEWLYVLVEETKHEIHHLEHTVLENPHNVTMMPCRRSNVMGALLQNASPFLFPCTIEYSLICAVIFYEMWKEIKPKQKPEKQITVTLHTKSRKSSVTPEKIIQQFASMLGIGSPYGSTAALHHFSVDCSQTHRGLFGGILLIVLTIISLIMFFVLVQTPDSVNDAIFQVNICELILYSVSLACALIALKQMRALPYKRKTGTVLCLDTSLLMLAQSGMFVYCMFSLIGCHRTMYTGTGSGKISFCAEFMSLLQTIVQSLFIIDGWWRRSTTSQQRREKPGRQLVTFMLVANMAMWAINTLEKNRAEFRPAHLKFYGPWAWTIITHVSMPLAIFYRFHSTICLFEIWKHSFMNKPLYLNV